MTETSQLMTCREIIAVDYGTLAKHMTALRERQTASCLILTADQMVQNITRFRVAAAK